MIVLLFLAVLVAVILGLVIYIAVDYDRFKKNQATDAERTASKLTTLSETDVRLKTDYNRIFADFASNVQLNDQTLASNQASLKIRLDDPLLSQSNQTLLKTRIDDPLFSLSNQQGLKNYYDNPLMYSSNLMKLTQKGAAIFNPATLPLPLDSNVNLQMLQKVSFLSGLTAKDLDESNPAEFCYKSTGQCTRIGSNVKINQNVWMNAPMDVSSTQKLAFKSDMNGRELASVSYDSNLGSMYIPAVSTSRIHMTGNLNTGTEVGFYSTDNGAAVILGQFARLTVAHKPTFGSPSPLFSVQKGYDGKVTISTDGNNSPLVIDGNLEVRGDITTRSQVNVDSNIQRVNTSLSGINIVEGPSIRQPTLYSSSAPTMTYP